MMITLGYHQFWFRKLPKPPIRERFDQKNGKVAQSKSFLEIGFEESYQLKTWYFGFGQRTLTYMRFVPDYLPNWMPLPGTAPAPICQGKQTVDRKERQMTRILGWGDEAFTHIGPVWADTLKDVWDAPWFNEIRKITNRNLFLRRCNPKPCKIFRALFLTDLSEVKCVIIGQDPYLRASQANGLAFGINEGAPMPPSLKNILKELESDLKVDVSKVDTTLEGWAVQGVLLLNSILTTEPGKSYAHAGIGWEDFTDRILAEVLKRDHRTPIIAWGTAARAKAWKAASQAGVDLNRYPIIEGAHPSPKSAFRGFFNTKPFSQVNGRLAELGVKPIRWTP